MKGKVSESHHRDLVQVNKSMTMSLELASVVCIHSPKNSKAVLPPSQAGKQVYIKLGLDCLRWDGRLIIMKLLDRH